MKKLTVLFLTILFAAGCSATKKADPPAKNADLVSFEYEAMTRGSYKKVIVTQDTITTIKDRDMKQVVKNPISKSDWETLVKSLDATSLDGLETLVAPTNKNHVDAALAAQLYVIKTEKTYRTPTFDHGNPPAEIKALVTKIIAISDLPKTK